MFNLAAIASTKIEDIFRPKVVGDPVNSHVVDSVREVEPDFDAMKRTIEGSSGQSPKSQRDRDHKEA